MSATCPTCGQTIRDASPARRGRPRSTDRAKLDKLEVGASVILITPNVARVRALCARVEVEHGWRLAYRVTGESTKGVGVKVTRTA